MTRHFILATAGHVDHGKSSLVKALTGIDPDRLPEEKARGITIELGFAHLDLVRPDDHQLSFRLGIVDVPGHEDFVKNMVAGVGSVDLALLVVAADDGWMPQTEEHLQILSYLGVKRLLVALTKVDLPAVDESAARESVRRQLQNTPFAVAPIIAVSTVTGRGLADLKSALLSILATAPPPRDIGKPRLAVDRAFTLRGVGTVVTGTLAGGTLTSGQSVVIQPGGQTARIRGIQSHNQELPSVGPGTRTALNLADIAVGDGSAGSSHSGVWRGDVVTLAPFGPPVSFLDACLSCSSRPPLGQKSALRPLRDGARVRVHHGTGNWAARLRFYEGKELAPGQCVIARLSFEEPLLAFIDDRFILRDWPEQATLAGGVVLALDSHPAKARGPWRQAALRKGAAALDDPRLRVAAQLQWLGLGRRSDFLLRSNFSRAETEGFVDQLTKEGKAVCPGELLADSSYWEQLCARAIEAIDAAHKSQPDRSGLQITQLRSVLRESMLPAGAFAALMTHLTANGFEQAGAFIGRRSHRAQLPAHLQATAARLLAALRVKPFEPPSRKELTLDAAAHQALRFLIESGQVVELGTEALMAREAYSRATEIIKDFLAAHRSATVSELRQAVGATRRVMVPLLERLDRTGVTVRQGDLRVLRQEK